MLTTISPNMNLIVPVVGVEPGPQWATDLNASLSTIDSHNHSPGQGVPVQPNGLDINADLTFQNNNGVNFRSTRFTPQGSNISLPADIGCLYEVGVDLWYNDGSGNQVRITQGGNVVGSNGNITGLVPPASASYNSFTLSFIWQSGIGIPATMDSGPVIIRDLSAPYNGITIQSPILAAPYNITLPATPPLVQSFMTMDASGNVAAPWTVDNVTIKIVANQLVAQANGLDIESQYSWKLNGKYPALTYPATAIDTVFVAPYDLTITSLWIYNGTAGSAGTTEFDIKLSNPGGPFFTILLTTGKITSVAIAPIWTDSNSIILPSTGVTKPVLGTIAILAGQVIRFDLLQAMTSPAQDAEIIINYKKT